jgi:beta-ureidopropionase
MSTVRVAFTQARWTGDKESMIALHEGWAREAASQGAQVIAFQELFYGPYFGITQDPAYYRYAEPVDGPTVERFAALAAELGIVMVLPIYEEAQPGVLYNTAVVVDADGTVLGSYRKHHIPNLDKFWEKFYFRPGNLGYPVFKTAVGPIGVYICYDRHFPEGWRELGLNGAQIVFNPNATKPGLSNRLWEIEQPAAAAANGYFVAAPNRVGSEANEYGDDAVTFYGSSQFVDPRGTIIGGYASADHEELVIRDLDLDLVRTVRNEWQFYRDRRPDSYTATTAP